MLLLPPGDQKPEFVSEMVARAIREELPTVECSGCKKVRKNGKWHIRASPDGHPHVTHGTCFECVR